MAEEEIWKDIEGYEEIYQVSDLGRIKSLKRGKEIYLKPGIDGSGYPNVKLFRVFKKTHLVHRIVALAFIPNPENKRTVNHKWGNKLDNRAVALEWATQSENILHSIRLGLRLYKSDNYKPKAIRQYSLSEEFINDYFSQSQAEKITGVNKSNISAACRKKIKQAGGFIWKYKI